MDQTQKDRLQAELSTAYTDHQKALHAHAYFRVPNRSMSQDLVQDTFLRTWNYLLRGGKIDVMKSFLYHVLRHLIIDEYRKGRTLSLDELAEQGFEPSTNPAKNWARTIDGKAALLMIQQLPLKYRKVIRMRYLQDLSLKDIALLTHQSTNTVAVQVHRGLQKLNGIYKHASVSA